MARRFRSIPNGTGRRIRRATRSRRGLTGGAGLVPLNDDELMYVRMNPRSYTPFGLGPLEVAFETVNTVSERAPVRGKAGKQLGGAVCAVAE